MSFSDFYVPPLDCAVANPDAVFQFFTVRFTLLSSRMIRIETSSTGEFEDRPSQVFWYRNQPLPPARIAFDSQNLTIETDVFKLTYHDSRCESYLGALNVLIKETGAIIHPEQTNSGIFPGTARTLDEFKGDMPMQPGFLSRSGWVAIDDTSSLLFNLNGWLETRPEQEGYRDLYLLISGKDYKAALKAYQQVAGMPTLLPRAFLGNWWSRYWEYSQADIQNLVCRFEKERIPLSVFIVDMDWHVTNTGNACSGWTGFSWNRDLFPEPEKIINWLHGRGLVTSLNLHPAEGIYPHEDRYPEAASALGLDPTEKQPIPFDIANPEFTQTYFNELLHPLEAQGVDFWWIDWQQGDQTNLPDLDPLWWLNHLHFYDLGRGMKKRPVVFSRWGGPGNHRYPIGFSGDTIVSWDTLAYQPYFTASAANVAYGWWSHDIGGHMRGIEDPELYTRWVQFGVLSPIFRLHCAKDIFIDRQPWAFDAETLKLTREAMQFRHALIPYLYTMAKRNTQEGLPVITPLYYDWPDQEEAFLMGGAYMFGSELLAAPVVSPVDPDLNQSRHVVWFPPGEWFNFFDGEKFTGPQWKIRYDGLGDIPLFARAGAIIPLQVETTLNGCENPTDIDLIAFPGKDGSFTLYEDDGVSQEYIQNGGVTTHFKSAWSDSLFSLEILPAEGEKKYLPGARSYRVLFRGIKRPDRYHVRINDRIIDCPLEYDEKTRTAIVGPFSISVDQQVKVDVFSEAGSLIADPPSVEAAVLRLLKRAKMETVTKWKINFILEEIKMDLSKLKDKDIKLSSNQLVALIETLTQTGAIKINHPEGSCGYVLINENGLEGFRCKNGSFFPFSASGCLPQEATSPIEVDYFGLVKKEL
jgi:alpha-glucosidase (family GH31 glycosyl hydrolase)